MSTGQDLQEVLDQNKNDLIGSTVLQKFKHSSLPYLPKVLSIAKALPLQLHPNKDLASKLHEKDPSNFTDPNHKPEIALALSDFEAFVGFKPLANIDHLTQLEPLKRFRPEIQKPDIDDQVLKHIVHQMLSASAEEVAEVGKALKNLPKDSFGYVLHLWAFPVRLRPADRVSARKPTSQTSSPVSGTNTTSQTMAPWLPSSL